MGYKENDKIRGLDTFDSFEEALEIAKRELVDFVLLGILYYNRWWFISWK